MVHGYTQQALDLPLSSSLALAVFAVGLLVLLAVAYDAYRVYGEVIS